MSKNTIETVTEEEEIVETTASLSSDGCHPELQSENTPQSELLGINEMSSSTSSEEEELDELTSSPNPTGLDDVTPSMESKSQLRNFLSVAKAKWDNVPQGWMQQRTNKDV
jgi:hypothetical protein